MSELYERARYRGYIYESNCWVVGNLIEKDGVIILRTDVGNYYISDKDKVSQTTGKVDIYDKEIFEGDILICVDRNTFISRMGVVVWNDNTVSFDVNDINGNKIGNAWSQCDLKICGNKYFDIDLLKHSFE